MIESFCTEIKCAEAEYFTLEETKAQLGAWVDEITENICQACEAMRTIDILRKKYPCKKCGYYGGGELKFYIHNGKELCPSCSGYGFDKECLWEDCHPKIPEWLKPQIWDCTICKGTNKVPSQVVWEVVEELTTIPFCHLEIKKLYWEGEYHRVFKLIEFLRRELK